MILGYGQGTGLTNRNLADIGGEEIHALSLAELASHNHGISISDPQHAHVVPAHGHGFNDPTHAHTGGNHQHLTMNHSHGTSDPGHVHNLYSSPSYQGLYQGGSNQNFVTGPDAWRGGRISAAGTGLTIAGSGNFWTDTDAARGGVATTGNYTGCSVANAGAFWDTNNATGITASSAAAGSGTGHNTLSPFAVLTYCIKASNPVPVGPTVPLADTTQAGLLTKVSGLATDFIGGDNACHDLVGQIKTVAPFVRSYNSIGNPNFELDSRTVGVGLPNTATSGWIMDRWSASLTGTHRGSIVQTAGTVTLPGTAFVISKAFARFTLTTQEATLAAGDFIQMLQQSVDGPSARELVNTATSITVVCRSTVAPLSFGVYIRDSVNGYSLTKLCNIANANTWTVIQLPNVAAFASLGTFPIAWGGLCYEIGITLSCGTTYTSSANDVWNSGNFIGAAGQSNFSASPVNSTFDVAFFQHEPGVSPSGSVIDKPFNLNLDECEHYYAKSVPYASKENVAGMGPTFAMLPIVSGWAMGIVKFPKRLVKPNPILRLWNPQTGTTNSAYGWPSGTNYTIGQQTPWGVNETGFNGSNMSSPAVVAGDLACMHWAIDTGW
jgi:hypothetical protein